MKYYILESGKKRYAVAAISRSDAHKKSLKLLGPGDWSYINMTTDKQEVFRKFKCNIVTERKV